MAGRAGTRMLSESEPTPAIATRSAISRNGSRCTGMALLRIAVSAARERAGGGVEEGAGVGIDERAERRGDARVIVVEPARFVGGEQLRHDQAAVDRRQRERLEGV